MTQTPASDMGTPLKVTSHGEFKKLPEPYKLLPLL